MRKDVGSNEHTHKTKNSLSVRISGPDKLVSASYASPVMFIYCIDSQKKKKYELGSGITKRPENEPAHDKSYNKTCAISKVRSACASAQSYQGLLWSHVPSIGCRLSKEGWTRSLAILRGCTGWSESLLVTKVLSKILSCAGSNITYMYTIVKYGETNTRYKHQL